MKYFIRSPNGFGCIKKLNGNRYRPYVFVITINGKQTAIAYFTNYKDACIYRAKYIAQNSQLAEVKEVYSFDSRETNEIRYDIDVLTMPTFKTVYNNWLPQHKNRHNVTSSTICGYENAFKHCITIQDMPINKIKYQDLQSILDNIGKQNLSYSTKKKVKNLMSLVFQFAKANDYIDKDYVDLLDIGKNKPIRPHKPFSESEIKLIWKRAHEFFYDKILILLYTGMRINELLNLTKQNVNLEQRYLHVTKSKTIAGLRYVPIHSKILKFIKKYMSIKGEYLLMNGDRKFTYTSSCNYWKKIMKMCNLKHTIHDCRHTLATRLDNANANEIAKRKILGHAQQNVTEGYTHKNIEELIKTIELLT